MYSTNWEGGWERIVRLEPDLLCVPLRLTGTGERANIQNELGVGHSVLQPLELSRVCRLARYVITAADQTSSEGFSASGRTGIGSRGGWTERRGLRCVDWPALHRRLRQRFARCDEFTDANDAADGGLHLLCAWDSGGRAARWASKPHSSSRLAEDIVTVSARHARAAIPHEPSARQADPSTFD